MITKFELYFNSMKTSGKRALAKKLGVTLAYLYLIVQRKRNAGADILMKIESATDGTIKPVDIRR